MDPITLGLIGSGIGGLLGAIGSAGRSNLDFTQERKFIDNFVNIAGGRSSDMYNYGKDYMNPNSGFYRGALADIGRTTDIMMDSGGNEAAGYGANAYNRMRRRMRAKAMDSAMGAFGDIYRQGSQNAANMFGLSKDFSSQQLGAMQIGAAMKEKQWESDNAGPEALQKAGFGLLGTFGGSLLGSDKAWGGGSTGDGGGFLTKSFDIPKWESPLSKNNMFGGQWGTRTLINSNPFQ